jgi:3-hydroxybutyryl-CoA dehydrogenase
VQESVPERLEIKHDLYAKIEPHLGRGVLIGTSTSGLTLTALQEGMKDPGGLLLTHPFNPPHLIPLVELMDNAQTRQGALAEGQAFYESIGKSCIRLNKEVPGHVANRLQAAVWREAIHLAMEGVASVKDIDTAISHGPGLRWAAMGPTTTFHLGGGAGGIRAFCDHLTGPFESWWADLGAPHLTPEVVEVLAKGLEEATAGQEMQDLVQRRDDLVLTYVKAAMARDNG